MNCNAFFFLFQGFQFDFYVQVPDKEPKHVGYSYLLPMEMKNSNDTKMLPITGLKHKPIGQIKGMLNKNSENDQLLT